MVGVGVAAGYNPGCRLGYFQGGSNRQKEHALIWHLVINFKSCGLVDDKLECLRLFGCLDIFARR